MRTQLYLSLFLPVFLIYTPLLAQHQINGILTDGAGEPLAFANVLLLQKADSSLVKGAVVNEDGSYRFDNIADGDYLLEFNMIGYATRYSESFQLAGAGVKIVETVALTENVTELSEVEVVARKPIFEQEIDRLVINVESSITLAGGSALDVLERSPGVMVNRQNRTISLAGKDGVVIMINEKQTRMDVAAVVQMLAGMNASNIEKVELITIPPANFDAEGNAGIINIVLKENTGQGLNGDFSVYAGYGLGEKYGGSLNFNYRENGINLFGNYSYALDHNPQVFTNYRSILVDGEQIETFIRSERDAYTNDHNARLGLDMELSDRTVIGILLTGYDSKWEMDAFNTIDITTDGELTQSIEVPNDELNQWRSAAGNLNLQHKFAGGGQLTADADYLFFHDNNPTNYVNTFYDEMGNLDFENETRVGKRTPISIYVAKVDYRRDIGENLTLETGLKGTASRFVNDVSVEYRNNGVWEFDPEFTREYELREDIGAAYASLGWKAGEKLSGKVGLRYEHTQSNLDSDLEQDIVDRKYGNFFPTLFLAYTINEDNTLQFAYNRRIQRPTFNDLAPFVIFLDPNTFFSGNPALQPGYSDGVRLEYRWKNFLIAANYSYDDEAISNFQPFVDPERNVQITASENMDFRQSASLMLSLPFYIGNWWTLQTNLMGYWQENNIRYGEGEIIQLAAYSLEAGMTNSFELGDGYGIEVSGFFLSPSVWGLGQSRPFGSLNVGVQKQFGENGGTLQLSGNDLLWTANWRMSADVPEQNLVLERYFRFSERVIRLTYTRSFGNQKVRQARQRATGSEAERNRVSN